MGGKKFHLKLLTPLSVLYDELTDYVIVRSKSGDMGVLYGHAPCTSILDYGMLQVYNGSVETDVFTVLGGVINIMDNEVVVLSKLAERPEKMQEALAQLAIEREEIKNREYIIDFDMHRAEKALRQSLVHLDVSAYSVMGGHKGGSKPK